MVELADNEIIKGLECCITENGDDCEHCPYGDVHYVCGSGGCCNKLHKDTLDLINRLKRESKGYRNKVQSQKGELARLYKQNAEQQTEIERYKGVIKLLKKDVADVKSEAVKEFGHMLIDKAENGVIYAMDIPDYVIEMGQVLWMEIKLTEAEVIEVLEYCEGEDGISYCNKCPLYDMNNCVNILSRKAREIICNKTSEIEQLREQLRKKEEMIRDIVSGYN